MTIKMRHCFNCGDELGEYDHVEPFEHCGKQECAREANHAHQAEREEAHERLDRDNGWS